GVFGVYQGASNHEELHNLMKATVMICRLKKDVLSQLPVKRRQQIYTDSAEAKIPAVLEYLGTVIEKVKFGSQVSHPSPLIGCKFLIFAHHQPMLDAIHEFLRKKKVGCIRIDGGTPAASRQQLVTDFQEKVYQGSCELCWTPGDLIQAEDRAHRIGQVSSVNIYYLLANDTVDDIIWDVVQF
ncbi:hypothetical protein PIB30_085242, partial [Stylosanthes scabra]|nr:hypothetical protein [Stylosanthes scabra]